MAGWHHRLDGCESGWTPGVGDGQGGLACRDSWGRKRSDTTERLNWTELMVVKINLPSDILGKIMALNACIQEALISKSLYDQKVKPKLFSSHVSLCLGPTINPLFIVLYPPFTHSQEREGQNLWLIHYVQFKTCYFLKSLLLGMRAKSPRHVYTLSF